MSKVPLTRWQLFKARRDSQLVENFQGLMPLPSIGNKDACTCENNKEIDMDWKIGKPANTVMHNKGDKLDLQQQTTTLNSESRDMNVNDNAISSKSYVDFDNRSKSTNGKYKWIRTAGDLVKMKTCHNSSFSDACKETSPLPLNLKESFSLQKLTSLRQKATIASNKLKLQEENPNFFVRNSRCVRHLPPINASQEGGSLIFRPSCPSPVSPPPTPTYIN